MTIPFASILVGAVVLPGWLVKIRTIYTLAFLLFCCHIRGMKKWNFQQQKQTEKRQPARGHHNNPSKDQLYAMLTDAWKNTQELSKRRKVGAVK
jgi:hypothetical protein